MKSSQKIAQKASILLRRTKGKSLFENRIKLPPVDPAWLKSKERKDALKSFFGLE